MSREIRFRAWNGEGMEYGGFSIHATGGVIPSEFGRVTTTSPIMQHTGMTDKNGTEIFEGDILEEEKGYYFLVEWNNRYAKFELIWKTKAHQYPAWNRGVLMEVIGNIHENEDLIK